MATQVKHRRGTQSEIDNFTPATAEIVVNTTESELVVGDGASQGGVPIPRKKGSVLKFDNISNATSNTSLKEGYLVELKERNTGAGGGGLWDVVLTSSVTPNGVDIVQCTGVPTLSLVLRINGAVNTMQLGASTDKTPAQNFSIINTFIDNCEGRLYGIHITVPLESEYGYIFTDATTYLQKTNPDSSCVCEDFTIGPEVNPAGLPRYGSQRRLWMFAEGLVEQNGDDTGIGNTAGNSTLIHGLWNPGLVMNVNGENIDNRRVKIFFGALGENYWSVGQGNLTIPYDAGDPNEISGSNEKRRRHWNIAGKTNDASGYQNKWVIRQDNGHQGWNIGEPNFTYHFTDNSNIVSTLTFMIENRESQSTQLVLKTGDEQVNVLQDNSNGGRLLIKNTAGENILQIGSDGEIFALKGVNPGRFTTTERNALTDMSFGTMVFDSTLQKPVWYDSPGVWRDATGTAV